MKKGINKNCQACGCEFYVPQYRKDTAKFCSINCQNHKQYKKWVFICEFCQKECISSPSRKNYRKKFCSLKCREGKSAFEKERRKKIKSLNVLSRGHNQSRTIRKYVFLYKDKLCESCGYKEHDFCLDIHHLDGNNLNNSLDNLKILCAICHRIQHYRGK